MGILQVGKPKGDPDYLDGERIYALKGMTAGAWKVRVDEWGTNSFSTDEVSALQAALDYAYNNRLDLKSSSVSNGQSDPNCKHMTAGVWGGHNTGGVLKNLKRILESGKIKIRKQPPGGEACPTAMAALFIKCRDIGDGRWGTIWLCDDFFAGLGRDTPERAGILMHECFHLLGADEDAAQQLELSTIAYW